MFSMQCSCGRCDDSARASRREREGGRSLLNEVVNYSLSMVGLAFESGGLLCHYQDITAIEGT
jgi:hypothetical protein